MRPLKFPITVLLLALVSNTVWAQLDPLANVRALTEAKKFDEALSELDAFLTRSPNHVEGKLYRGVIFTRKGDINAAISSFSQLSEEYPNLPEPHNNLAVLYAAQGRYEDARQALIRAVELQPGYDTAHENLGDLYTRLAIVSYRRASTLNPANQRALEKSQRLSEGLEARSTQAPSEVEILVSRPLEQTSTNPAHCYIVGPFTDSATLQKARTWFETRNATAHKRDYAEDGLIGYRVFIPPLANAAEAERQMEALKSHGIVDIALIREAGLANAISLGVYKSETSAANRLDRIRQLGFEATLEPRHKQVEASELLVSSDSAAFSTEGFESSFAGVSLTAAPCP